MTKFVKLISTDQPGYVQYLLGGAIRLASGDSITLTADQASHTSVRKAISAGTLKIVEDTDNVVEKAADAVDEAKKEQEKAQEAAKGDKKPKKTVKTVPEVPKVELDSEVADQVAEPYVIGTELPDIEIVDTSKKD